MKYPPLPLVLDRKCTSKIIYGEWTGLGYEYTASDGSAEIYAADTRCDEKTFEYGRNSHRKNYDVVAQHDSSIRHKIIYYRYGADTQFNYIETGYYCIYHDQHFFTDPDYDIYFKEECIGAIRHVWDGHKNIFTFSFTPSFEEKLRIFHEAEERHEREWEEEWRRQQDEENQKERERIREERQRKREEDERKSKEVKWIEWKELKTEEFDFGNTGNARVPNFFQEHQKWQERIRQELEESKALEQEKSALLPKEKPKKGFGCCIIS